MPVPKMLCCFLAGLCLASATFYLWTRYNKDTAGSSATIYRLTMAALDHMPTGCNEITVKCKEPGPDKGPGEAEVLIRYGKERPGLLPTMPISNR